MTLLFILPGIVAELSYSMSYFVKVDHPKYNWSQCISESKRLMSGHKGSFCLAAELSGVDRWASSAWRRHFVGLGLCLCDHGAVLSAPQDHSPDR